MDRVDLNDIFLILFGVYLWDFLTSLWFEYRLLTKKIQFRWQFVPYFLTRYFVLAYITSVTTANALIGFNELSLCTQASFRSAHLFIGLVSLVFSTWNLLIRTIIIWGHHPFVMKPLLMVGFLHFVLSIVVATVGRPTCNPLPPSIMTVMIFGTITAVIEFTILALSLVGIRRASRLRESHLAWFLKTQGIVYFVLVLILQLTMIITSAVQSTNSLGSACVGVVSTVIGPLLSCRLVTSTLSQDVHTDYNPDARMHRIECFELSGDRCQNSTSGRMTTCIDVTKDSSVC